MADRCFASDQTTSWEDGSKQGVHARMPAHASNAEGALSYRALEGACHFLAGIFWAFSRIVMVVVLGGGGGTDLFPFSHMACALLPGCTRCLVSSYHISFSFPVFYTLFSLCFFTLYILTCMHASSFFFHSFIFLWFHTCIFTHMISTTNTCTLLFTTTYAGHGKRASKPSYSIFTLHMRHHHSSLLKLLYYFLFSKNIYAPYARLACCLRGGWFLFFFQAWPAGRLFMPSISCLYRLGKQASIMHTVLCGGRMNPDMASPKQLFAVSQTF